MDDANLILTLTHRVEQGELSTEQALAVIRTEADAGTLTTETVQLAASHVAERIRSNSRQALLLTELCYAASALVSLSASDRSVLLLNLGSCCLYLDQLDRAKLYLSQALPLARTAGDLVVEATIQTNLASVAVNLGQLDEAHKRLRRALPKSTQAGQDGLQVALLKIEGSLHRREGNAEDALVVYQEAIAVIRETGKGSEHEAGILGNLGNVLHDLKRPEDALRYYRDGVEVARQAKDWRVGANNGKHLAETLVELGRPADAATAYEGAAECALNGREVDRAAGLFEEATRCWMDAKNLTQAATCLNQGLALVERTGNRKQRLSLLQTQVGLRAERKDWEGALAACQEGLALAQQANDAAAILKFLHLTRLAYDVTGNKTASMRLTQTAVELAFAQTDPKHLSQALGVFSDALPLVESAHAVRHGRHDHAAALEAVRATSPSRAVAKSTVLLITLLTAEHSQLVYLLGTLLTMNLDCLKNGERMSLGSEYGLAAMRVGDLPTAHEQFDAGLAIARASGDLRAQATLLSRMGVLLRTEGRLSEARQSLEESLSLRDAGSADSSYANLLGILGNTCADQNDFVTAERHFRRALDIHRRARHEPGIGSATMNLAELHLRKQEYALAIPLLHEALTIFLRTGSRAQAGNACTSLTIAHLELGDAAKVREYSVPALALTREVGNALNEARLLTRLGQWSRSLGDPGQALQYLDAALGRAEQIGNVQLIQTITAETAELRATEPKDLAGAVTTLNQAREECREAGDRISETAELDRAFDEPEVELPVVIVVDQRSVEVSRSDTEALEPALSSEVTVNDPSQMDQFHNQIGDLDAVRANTNRATESLEFGQTLASQTDSQSQIEHLTTVAVHLSQGSDDPARALDLCREAIVRVEQLHQRMPQAEQRRTLLSQFVPLHDEIVTCLMNNGCFEEAFTFVERMKTRALCDLLAQKDEVPSNVATLRESGAVDLKHIRQQLPPGCVLVEFAILRQGAVVFLVPSDRTPVQPPPKSAKLTDASNGLRPRNEWVDELGLHVVTLPNFTLDDLNRLLVDPSLGWLRVYEGFQTGEQQFRQLLAILDRTLSTLHQQLLAPVQEILSHWEGVKSLLLVPHRGLHLLPLDAAWDQPRNPVTGVRGERRYLRDCYSVSCAPSVSVWTRSVRQPEDMKLLAQGNPTRDLEFSEREVEAIGRLLPDRARVLRGPEATRRAVLELAPELSHLHLSCHATFDRERPTQSGLLLAEAPLTVEDMIEHLRLMPGAVVVLSACDAGRTDHTDLLDEYTAIASGFLHAGAGTVVSTLWPVDDLSMLVLMDHFYTKLRETRDPCRVLRSAQEAVRTATVDELTRRFAEELPAASERFAALPADSRPFAHPYYWAGFVVTGVAATTP